MDLSSSSDRAASADVNASMFNDERADEFGNSLRNNLLIQSDRSIANELKGWKQ